MLESIAEPLGVLLEYAAGSHLSNGNSAHFIARPTLMRLTTTVSGTWYWPLAASSTMRSWMLTISRWPVIV